MGSIPAGNAQKAVMTKKSLLLFYVKIAVSVTNLSAKMISCQQSIFFKTVIRRERKLSMAEKKELSVTEEKVVEIEMERLRSFGNHPFKVKADSQMIELQESVKVWDS